jgi:hypothetical protein
LFHRVKNHAGFSTSQRLGFLGQGHSRANSSQVGINTRSLAISSVLQNSIQAELLIDKKNGLSRLEAASHRRRRPNP